MSSRSPNYEFQEWWNSQRERNLHSAFQLDQAESQEGGWRSVEIGGRSPPPSPPSTSSAAAAVGSGKGRGRSARQLSWLCLLRFNQSAAVLAGLPLRLLGLLVTANRRISSSPSDGSSRLYRVIRCFLVLAVVLLVLEVAAYFKGWHFMPPTHAEAVEALEMLYAHWLYVRANYLAPPVQVLANVCIVLFMVQSVDRLVLVLGCFWIKFRRLRPVAAVGFGGEADAENGGVGEYPMVLLQIPMCNEREVRRRRSFFGSYFSLKLWLLSFPFLFCFHFLIRLIFCLFFGILFTLKHGHRCQKTEYIRNAVVMGRLSGSNVTHENMC